MQNHFHWSHPPEQCPLSDDEVHVWVAALEATPNFDEFPGVLSLDEQHKADRFYFARDKQSYVAGRGLLREILGSYTGTPPARLKFDYGKNGKPSLATGPEEGKVNFNLSHSGGLVLIAVAQNRELGIDLEQLRPFPEMESVAARCFSHGEQVALQHLEFPHKEENFFRYWTRKEAQLKCSGKGISEQAEFIAPHFDGFLQELEPAAGYLAALAVRGKPFALKLWQWQTNCRKQFRLVDPGKPTISFQQSNPPFRRTRDHPSPVCDLSCAGGKAKGTRISSPI